jgi:hypothetical protein
MILLADSTCSPELDNFQPCGGVAGFSGTAGLAEGFLFLGFFDFSVVEFESFLIHLIGL